MDYQNEIENLCLLDKPALTYQEEIKENLQVEYLPVLSNEIYSQSHQAYFLDKRNSQRQWNK